MVASFLLFVFTSTDWNYTFSETLKSVVTTPFLYYAYYENVALCPAKATCSPALNLSSN